MAKISTWVSRQASDREGFARRLLAGTNHHDPVHTRLEGALERRARGIAAWSRVAQKFVLQMAMRVSPVSHRSLTDARRVAHLSR